MSIVSVTSGSRHPDPVKVGFGSGLVQIRRIVSSLRVQGRNEWSSFGLNVESSRVQSSTRGTGRLHGSGQICNRYIPDPGFYEKAWYIIWPAVIERFKALPTFIEGLYSSEYKMKSRRIACQLVAEEELMKKPWMEEFGSKLKKQGWEKLLQESALVNESQFKQFYSSLQVEKTENGFIGKFEIGGKIHSFTNLDVARLMGVSCGGYDHYIHFAAADDEEKRPNDESNVAKLLHHIATKSLLPGDENWGINLNMDMVIVDHLMREKKVNLPSLMMQHMKYCKISEEKALPYPGLVKKLLVDGGVYKEEDEEVYEIQFDESWVDSKGFSEKCFINK